MRKRLHARLLGSTAAPLMAFSLLCFGNTLKAQIINETFEESIWTSLTAASTNATVSGSSSGQVNITATSTAQTITYYTGYQQSTATATYLNTVPNSGTWFYNKASVGSSTYTRLSKARSKDNWIGVSSGGYIVTPILVNGVATVVFSVNVTTDFAVGIYTNTTAPGQPTHLSINSATGGVYTVPTAYTYASQVYLSSSLTTATVATNSTGGVGTINNSAQLVTFTGTFTGPCRVGIFNLQSSGLGIDDIVITSNASMPVSFGTISAAQKNSAVTVQWNILTAVNTAKYIVEKSGNGSNFIEAIQLNAGNADKVYKWVDVSPLSGNNFYRIKAVDNDGKLTYSSIVKVNNKGNVKPEMIISSNPVTNGQLHVQLNDLEKGSYQLLIYDMAGRKILAASISHEEGSSVELVRLPAWIRKGTYNVQLLNEQTRMNTTILVE